MLCFSSNVSLNEEARVSVTVAVFFLQLCLLVRISDGPEQHAAGAVQNIGNILIFAAQEITNLFTLL